MLVFADFVMSLMGVVFVLQCTVLYYIVVVVVYMLVFAAVVLSVMGAIAPTLLHCTVLYYIVVVVYKDSSVCGCWDESR